MHARRGAAWLRPCVHADFRAINLLNNPGFPILKPEEDYYLFLN
jgi:hypothetical protein